MRRSGSKRARQAAEEKTSDNAGIPRALKQKKTRSNIEQVGTIVRRLSEAERSKAPALDSNNLLRFYNTLCACPCYIAPEARAQRVYLAYVARGIPARLLGKEGAGDNELASGTLGYESGRFFFF